MHALASTRTTLAPNGIAARIVLAILASAGILYANLGPLIVSGLARDAEFTGATAGYLLSVNMYGTAIGGVAILFFIRRLDWRWSAAALSLALIAADLGSAQLAAASTLSALRFIHGIAGGALIGVISSVIARTTGPERTFALNVVIQLVLGGVATAALAPVVLEHGVAVIWLSLVAFTALGLLLLPLLDRYPAYVAGDGSSTGRGPLGAIALGCAAIFIYQAGEMAAFAYLIELGVHHRLDAEFVGRAVAVGLWLGGPAGLLVAWWSTRSGRLLPSSVGALLTAAAISLLFAPTAPAYLLANIGFGVFFSLTIPYLQGVVAEMDNRGEMAAVAGFMSSLGLASGPALAATLLGENHYERVLLFAVVALGATALFVAHPARMLDRRDKHGRVVW